MNIRTKVVCLFILIFLSGCFSGKGMTIESKLIKYFDSNCVDSEDVCLVDMSKVLSDEWEYIYIFNRGETAEAIAESIEIPYDLYEDVGYKFIAVNHQAINYYSEVFLVPSYKKGSKNIAFRFHQILENQQHVEMNFRYYKISKSEPMLAIRKHQVSLGNSHDYELYSVTPISQQQIQQ